MFVINGKVCCDDGGKIGTPALELEQTDVKSSNSLGYISIYKRPFIYL